MKIVIPSAGFGKRLRPHTYTKPKPLLNVAGKPVLGHVLDKIKDLEIEEVIFIVGWLGEQIEAYVRENYSFPSRYVEQRELLGQAHAIWLARDYLEGPVFIIFVDTIFEADLSRLEDVEADGVLYVKEVEDPRRFGVVVLEKGYIKNLIEKPEGFEHNLAIVGLYYIKDSQFLMDCIEELIAKDIKTKGEYYLADALQIMIESGARFITRKVDVWEDCGKPETVLHTNRYLLEHGHDNSEEVKTYGFLIVPPVHIDPSARISNSIIGPYVTIASGCEIRGSIIRDSIIDEGAYIEEVMLEQSLIGQEARVSGRYRRLNVGDSSNVDFGG